MIFRIIGIVAANLLLFSSLAFCVTVKRSARVVEANGKVETKNSSGKWISVNPEMVLNEGDFIRTDSSSEALIEIIGETGNSRVRVKPNSQMQLVQLVEDNDSTTQNTMLDLALGELLIDVDKLDSQKSKFEVKTPTSLVGVRGTTFKVTVDSEE
ncbi:MAG TPA: FecR family protein [Candidatus Omnitrophota bacterium]|nr:FecR family protein [Candidatus Omnitrophota bacterium]